MERTDQWHWNLKERLLYMSNFEGKELDTCCPLICHSHSLIVLYCHFYDIIWWVTDGWCTASSYSQFLWSIWRMQNMGSVVNLLCQNPHCWPPVISSVVFGEILNIREHIMVCASFLALILWRNSVFWGMTACSLLGMYYCVRGSRVLYVFYG